MVSSSRDTLVTPLLAKASSLIVRKTVDEQLNDTEVRAVQPWKAELSMLVTLAGMATVVRDVHPLKARLPTLVTPAGIAIVINPEYSKTLLLMLVNKVPVSKDTEVRAVQPLKAILEILVTLAGIKRWPLLPTAEQSRGILTTRHVLAGTTLPLAA